MENKISSLFLFFLQVFVSFCPRSAFGGSLHVALYNYPAKDETFIRTQYPFIMQDPV